MWSETDENGENFDGMGYDFSEDTQNEILADCAAFVDVHLDILTRKNASQAGHDFCLSRNGHGAGFWDGCWPEYGDKLHEDSKPYGSFHLYLTDDHELHHHS